MVECVVEKSELLLDIAELLGKVAEMEGKVGAASALMRYGSGFPLCRRVPEWFKKGRNKNCYANATISAAIRDDVWYAEGYAADPKLPFPVEHAWLIDASGEVIDPTWRHAGDQVYFGIAFQRGFVLETLEQNSGETGILVNMHRLRRHHRGEGCLERALARGVQRHGEGRTPCLHAT